MLIVIVYLLGFCISLYLFQQINKRIKSKYDKIGFDDAVFASFGSWLTVVIILLVSWYNQSSLKTVVDNYIKDFEGGK